MSKNLHESNPFCASSIFCDIPSDIIELPTIAYPWCSTVDTSTFSGIPPHVTHMTEMEMLKMELANLRDRMVAELGSAMDERGFASKEHNTNKILNAMDVHSEKMAAMALKSAEAAQVA